MKTLIAAFSIALLGILGVYAVLSILKVEQGAEIAGAIIGGVPYLRTCIDKYLASRSQRGSPVLSFDQFGLPPQRLILYGSLMLFGAMELAGGIIGINASTRDIEPEKLLDSPAALTTMFIIQIPVAFLIGRWVGRRSVRKGFISILFIVLVARAAATAFDTLINPEVMYTLLTNLGQGSVIYGVAVQIIYSVVLMGFPGALGYWRGRRQQLGSYLGYLLRSVPDSTSHVIVGLAFEEARQVSASKKPPVV